MTILKHRTFQRRRSNLFAPTVHSIEANLLGGGLHSIPTITALENQRTAFQTLSRAFGQIKSFQIRKN